MYELTILDRKENRGGFPIFCPLVHQSALRLVPRTHQNRLSVVDLPCLTADVRGSNISLERELRA